MKCNKKQKDFESERKAIDSLPGAALDQADDNRVDHKLEKQRTKTLDNNPRDTDS